ncbi:MAG: VOC family protein [Gammaproteobacteria bacterium]|jgi:predicted enzyme related to lactoylglutathione lyase|nr:VOC family protein [Gammaproteobacteria bacterium]MDP6652098.1 VOC family protein [Gammaproteobacteria bacterium]|tara:strand:- start:70 stop:450 length:381 start_codon:yes stop_codon:yes gene_type:complete
MQIKLCSVFVEDQSSAQIFYTEQLGFEVVADIDLGEFRWLTVSEKGNSGVELLLEPNAHPAALVFQQAIYADGIPAAVLYTEDINHEYENLIAKGVSFKDKPTNAGGAWIIVFDDTCGNWIQLVQV